MKIIESEEFRKDFKKLKKKYKSLDYDLQYLKEAIEAEPTGNGTKHWNLLKKDNKKYIFKLRMMCRSIRSSSFRVIYFYNGEEVEILLIEIYFKGKKENEDEKKIDDFWDKIL